MTQVSPRFEIPSTVTKGEDIPAPVTLLKSPGRSQGNSQTTAQQGADCSGVGHDHDLLARVCAAKIF
jgi:hypothetical protein